MTEILIIRRKKRNVLSAENIPGVAGRKGGALMRHFTNTPAPQPNNVNVKAAAREARKVAKKHRKSLLTPKYRAEQLPNHFSASDDVQCYKFCQDNVEWKGVDTDKDHLWSKT